MLGNKNVIIAAENRTINQAGSKHFLLKQIKKAFNRLLKTFQKYHIIVSDIVSKIAATEVFLIARVE